MRLYWQTEVTLTADVPDDAGNPIQIGAQCLQCDGRVSFIDRQAKLYGCAHGCRRPLPAVYHCTAGAALEIHRDGQPTERVEGVIVR